MGLKPFCSCAACMVCLCQPAFSLCVHAWLLGCVWLFATACTVAYQVPLSMDSPGKNTGVGCHALLQGIFWLKDQTRSLALHADSLPSEPPAKPSTVTSPALFSGETHPSLPVQSHFGVWFSPCQSCWAHPGVVLLTFLWLMLFGLLLLMIMTQFCASAFSVWCNHPGTSSLSRLSAVADLNEDILQCSVSRAKESAQGLHGLHSWEFFVYTARVC